MKTAIYVEDGVTQIVLTPVTAFEREVLARISREELTALRVVKGAFYCGKDGLQQFGGEDQSLILRLGSHEGVTLGEIPPAHEGHGISIPFPGSFTLDGPITLGDA